jgi:hypothetical protein
MIKYIILIICIAILLYILFRYQEGFEPLNNNVSILDISKNLLTDNSYTFIDGSLNVLYSDKHYPDDLFDINTIVDDIVVDDVSYNQATINKKNALDKMMYSKANQDKLLASTDDLINQFDSNLRTTINDAIKNTMFVFTWAISPTTPNPTGKYDHFNKTYLELLALRDKNLTNPAYSYSSTFYNDNEASKKTEKQNSFTLLNLSRQYIFNNYSNTLITDELSTDKDKLLLDSISNINSDINNYNTYLSTFNTKYSQAMNPLGPGITKVDFSFNILNFPDISDSLSKQKNYMNELLKTNYDSYFKPHYDNINYYVNNFDIKLQPLDSYNDLSMNTKINTIKQNITNKYNDISFNLAVFNVYNDSNVLDPTTNILLYSDPSLNNKIEYSKGQLYNYAYNKQKYSTMANRLYNISVNTDSDFNTLYNRVKNDYITQNNYITLMKQYCNAVNRDILNENSLIESINNILKTTCPTRLLKTNPNSTYISTSSSDLRSYLNNTSITNLSYYGTYSRTNTGINCNEVDRQPTISTSNNLTILRNFTIDVASAIDFYGRMTNYNNMMTSYTAYITYKSLIDSLLVANYGCTAYSTSNRAGSMYSSLISNYVNITDTISYLNLYIKPCAIKKYAKEVYSYRKTEYDTKLALYIDSYNKKNIKTFFDYIYTNLEPVYSTTDPKSTLRTFYDSYIVWNKTYLNDLAAYNQRTIEFNNALATLKNRDGSLHSRISNTIQDVFDTTQEYNINLFNKMVKQKEDEMTNTINTYTETMSKAKQDAFNYITKSNELLQKQQDQFNGGLGTDTQLNNFLDSQGNPFATSDATRNGKIDRYVDPSCGANEFIYCLGGKIECVDIYGDTIDAKLEDLSDQYSSYTRGKTYGKCGSFLKKVNINEYANNMSENLIQTGNVGYFYDVKKCPTDKPWRVGGEGTPIGFNDCYVDQDKASAVYTMIRKSDPSDFLNKSVVYIESEYILHDYAVRFPNTISILNNTNAKWVGNQRMYQGVIKSMNKNNLFDVYVPDESGILLNDIEPQKLRLPNINVKSTPQLDNLPKGSEPRPICRYGKFSEKCSKGDDPPIDFKSSDIASKELELNKYLITPKYEDSKYITGANSLDDLYTTGTSISNSNNTLGFSLFN